ncbi:electron transport protein SCO1/SenC [Pseudomonas saudimassiliensis]|uniref:Electron transport protein SCO1/SenC n=1 Tax=Pseudomonas saudimassiliensis TaxID=1461581 RepID=A0A078MHB8_9PSED|nr:SCO family protein [Pseudomonas saudimassiliensis]CEA04807.1 electron transport protein SCO1/SenC [Pseudomonas saudimassiliensis]CEF26806.1 electron transport protein SCO1/SenC [Pseudomonas saudimassiliensis]
MALSGVQKTVLITVAVIALVIGAVVNKVLRPAPLDRDLLSENGVYLFDEPRRLPAVSLQSASGGDWSTTDLQGQWDLLFFGYTFCPDICPTTMAELRQVTAGLPQEQADNLRVTMISVDPQRDTPQQMRQYLEFFKAGFHGATGEPEQLGKLAQALSVAYIEPDTSTADYLVDHSGQVVMVDPAGHYVGFLRPPLNPQQLSQWLPRIMEN